MPQTQKTTSSILQYLHYKHLLILEGVAKTHNTTEVFPGAHQKMMDLTKG